VISRILTSLIAFQLFMGHTYHSVGQNPDWMVPGKSYYRIPVSQDGMYRITSEDISKSGLPIAAIDARNIQIFHRGNEQAITVTGQNDTRLDPQDFIEFYGQKNDGTLDGDLYTIKELQPHIYYNLFSDTTAYFLTWGVGNERGKRIQMQSEFNSQGLVKEQFVWKERINLFTNEYSRGYSLQNQISSSRFVQGEGFSGSRINAGSQIEIEVESGIKKAGSPNGILEIQILGRNSEFHEVEIWIGQNLSSLRLAGSFNSFAYSPKITQLELIDSDINDGGKLLVRVKNINNNRANQVSVSYIKTKIPVEPNADAQNQFFQLEQKATEKTYLELSGISQETEVYDVSNPDSPIKLGLAYQDGILKGIITNTGNGNKLFVLSSRFLISKIAKVENRPLVNLLNDYIIITHEILRKPGESFTDPISEYAKYRSSASGGGFNPIIIGVNEIFNHFSYGERTPLGIFNFLTQLSDEIPRHIFLIGKGLETSVNPERTTAALAFNNLVPTSGSPGSDIIYSSGLTGLSSIPKFATGRLSASTSYEVESYLKKIIVAESIKVPRLFQKEILHLSGGVKPEELSTFKSHLDSMMSIASNSPVGAKVQTLQKKSTKDYEFIDITQKINEGVGLVTFFGHSASNLLDIDVGFVTNPELGYDNYGKYPIFYMNGCNIGSVYGNSYIQSEDWVLAKNKGAIAVMGLSNLGAEQYLSVYGNLFYKIAFDEPSFYGKGLGEIQQELNRRYESLFGTSYYAETHLEQMVLLGDPAVKLVPYSLPDYAFQKSAISLTQPIGELNTNEDIKVQIAISNNGILSTSPLQIAIRRRLQDGSPELLGPYSFIITGTSQSLEILIPNKNSKYAGFNELEIVLDPENQINEIEENNNFYNHNFYVKDRIPLKVNPYPYALLPSHNFEFVLLNKSGDNSFITIAPENNFSNPIEISLQNENEIARSFWDSGADGISTYYWKTSSDNEEWSSVSSFTLQTNDESRGWTQRHPAQISENSIEGITIDEQNNWTWQASELSIHLETIGGGGNYTIEDVVLELNSTAYIYSSRLCSNNTLNLLAFDRDSLVPYLASSEIPQCGRTPQIINSIHDETLQTFPDLFLNALTNIAEGDFVLLFSIGTLNFDLWPADIFAELEQFGLGSPDASMLIPGNSLFFVGKKGGSATQLMYGDSEVLLSTDEILSSQNSEGTITTQLIGPASYWNSFQFTVSDIMPGEFTFDIVAIDTLGNSTNFIKGIKNETDLRTLDAAKYPNIKLKYFTKGDEPRLLNDWTVLYTPQPEGHLSYLGNSFNASPGFSVDEGRQLSVEFAFTNLSQENYSDSLEVYLEQTVAATETRRSQMKIASPPPGETIIFNVDLTTMGMVGENSFFIEVNDSFHAEKNSLDNKVQLFQFFTVVPDDIDPVIDVFVDGKHIINGDHVSSDPEITINYWDSNPYLIRENLDNFIINFGTFCDTCALSRVELSSSSIHYYLEPGKNILKIDYKPGKLTRGKYLLEIFAPDMKGNSPEFRYELLFEITNSETRNIKVQPAPNPFNKSLNFIFDIEAQEIPSGISLAIFNARGQLIFEEEITLYSTLKVGLNRIEIPWKISNEPGIYYYKVRVIDDEEWMLAPAGNSGSQGIIIFVR
jgi:hypothetical protein